MIRTTPFHLRTNAANQTGLWTHWSGHLAALQYQTSEKFEYFAIRNAAGLFDTSPLYKYQIAGPDAERYLAGVLARDIRMCRSGRAHYTIWCDDRGFVLEDGVVFRISDDEFFLTAAEPNLAYFASLVGHLRVEIEDVSANYAALALQGPRATRILAALVPEVESLDYFRHMPAKLADAAVTISRTGFTGDLGYEIWAAGDDAVAIWDAVMEAGRDHGLIPFGLTALKMARIEAGLLLLDTDFASSRFAWNDEHRSTPLELGLGWMFRNLTSDDRSFIGRQAIEREIETGSARWAMVGLVVDWAEYDQAYRSAGLIAPMDHKPPPYESMVYDDERTRVGYTASLMYSPVLQKHIAIARVRPELATPGTRVNLEVTIDHAYELVGAHVTRLPFFNPARKTA
ncbi:MAG TPA: aminomethyltransferase family protein [Acidimicrobiia bacterium]|nr:aminomethyltransferase family protein [Acidimicrobiia bacterium]